MEKDYPKEIKRIIAEIKRNGGYTEKIANSLTELIKNGAWLWTILYFPKPLSITPTDVVNLDYSKEEFVTLTFTSIDGLYIPLFTSYNYCTNLKDINQFIEMPFSYVVKVSVDNILTQTEKIGIQGLIINPHIEGIVVNL